MENFKKMSVYSLFRTFEQDKNGRPIIFLSYLGYESLVWIGTTKIANNSQDKPFTTFINDKKTHFYDKGIVKVKTNNIKNYWRNNVSQKVIIISNDEQKLVIGKLSKLTNQSNPYEIIKNLEQENNLLRNKIFSLEKEKDIIFER